MNDETKAEATTDEGAADKAVAKAVEDAARDLSDDGGAVVDDGQGNVPAGPTHGANARKALYKKHRSQRQREIQADIEANPSLGEQVDAIEGRTTSTPDSIDMEVHPAPDVEAPPVEPIAQPAPDTQPAAQPDQQLTDPNELITVTVNGERRQVPRRDIDAHGGKDNYEVVVASNERFRQAAQMRKEADERLRQAQQLEDERNARGQGRSQPETRGRRRSTTDLPSHEDARGDEWSDTNSMSDAEFDNWYLDELYSGDKARGRRAREADRRRQLGQQPVTEPGDLSQPSSRQSDQTEQPIVIAGRTILPDEAAEIDAMMSRDYGEIVRNPGVANDVRAMFENLMADPRNEKRMASDVLRQAADYYVDTLEPAADPRDKLVQRQQAKAQMPTRPASTSTAPVAASEEAPLDRPTGRHNVIAEMRKRRGQPPQAPLKKKGM